MFLVLVETAVHRTLEGSPENLCYYKKKWLSQIFCKSNVSIEMKDPELNQATHYMYGWRLWCKTGARLLHLFKSAYYIIQGSKVNQG